jgi:uncharacterized membrane protein YqjE
MNDHSNPQSQHDATDQTSGPVIGILHSVKQVLATLLSMVNTRLELFAIELQEEVQRIAVSLLWSLAALFALGIGCFLATLTLIIIFWDTHRVLVAISATAAFFGFALFAIWIVVKRVRNHPPLLQGTLSELKRDQEVLRSRP